MGGGGRGAGGGGRGAGGGWGIAGDVSRAFEAPLKSLIIQPVKAWLDQ